MKDIGIKDLRTGDVFIGKEYYNNYYIKVVDKLVINMTDPGHINVVYKYIDRYGDAHNDHDFYESTHIVTKISI